MTSSPGAWLDGVELLVVGSPTRGFRPTKAIDNFLNGLPSKSLSGVKVAAFDTRISITDIDSRFLTVMVKVFGYAAEPIAKKLVKKGGQEVIPPAGFIVKDSEGPLKEGELERARDWGRRSLAKARTVREVDFPRRSLGR